MTATDPAAQEAAGDDVLVDAAQLEAALATVAALRAENEAIKVDLDAALAQWEHWTRMATEARTTLSTARTDALAPVLALCDEIEPDDDARWIVDRLRVLTDTATDAAPTTTGATT